MNVQSLGGGGPLENLPIHCEHEQDGTDRKDQVPNRVPEQELVTVFRLHQSDAAASLGVQGSCKHTPISHSQAFGEVHQPSGVECDEEELETREGACDENVEDFPG